MNADIMRGWCRTELVTERPGALNLGPILDTQAGLAGKVARVAREQGGVMHEGDAGDLQVHRAVQVSVLTIETGAGSFGISLVSCGEASRFVTSYMAPG